MQVNKLSVSPINKNIVIPNLEGLGGWYISKYDQRSVFSNGEVLF